MSPGGSFGHHRALPTALGGVDGEDLRTPADPERGLYFEAYYGYLSYGWSPLAGWVDDSGKYLHSTDPELFDLEADQDEQHNLFSPDNTEVTRYRRAMASVLEAPALDNPGFEGPTEDLLEDLRGLGYVAAGAIDEALPSPLAPSDRPSPRSRADLHERAGAAIQAIGAGRLEEAEATYRAILADNPQNTWIMEKLATLSMQRKRPMEALATLEKLVARGPQKPGTYLKLAACLRAVGRVEEAVEALRVGAQRSRGGERFVGELVRVLESLGRVDEARAVEEQYR